MRVGFDARWYNDSGVGSYVAELVKAMAPLQQDVELIVYENPRNPVPGLDELPIERVPLSSPKYSFLEQWELPRRCREDKLDIFHSPFYVVPLVAPCPVVVTVHDLIPFLFRIYAWPKQQMIRMGYRLAVRQSTRIIADSHRTAQDLQDLLKVSPAKITVIPMGVSQSDFHANQNEGELDDLRRRYDITVPYVMAASARNWRTKNLKSALQTLILSRRKTEVSFQTVVYGPGNGLEALQPGNDWRELNLRRLGYVPARDLGALFRYALLFLMPSLYEGFGLPALEAMSCGCPVVTSNAGSLAEVAGSGAQTFAPNDVEGMAGAVAQLLHHPEDVKKWRNRALQRARDFSWERAAEETISVYHRALQGNR